MEWQTRIGCEGFFARFGIDAAILEFNCISGLKEPTLGKHWVSFGEGLVKAFEA